MARRSAHFYDALYETIKDYAEEARRVHELIRLHKRSQGSTLLDVACGTGQHLAHLRRHYAVEGLDIDEDMLAIAAQRSPGISLHRADMRDFDLGRAFDVVLCLFSAIGYMTTVLQLRRAIRTMSNHLRPGGVLIVEPWITLQDFKAGHVAAIFVDQPDLKVARMNASLVRGRLSILDFRYLLATPAGVEHFRERLTLGLFTTEEYEAAFRAAGLAVTHDPVGLMGRGLYVGTAAIPSGEGAAPSSGLSRNRPAERVESISALDDEA